MTSIKLPPEVLKTLPEPDRNGLVRVVVALQVGQDGEAQIDEINDVPLSSDDDPEDQGDQGDDESAEGEEPMPSPGDIEQSVYGSAGSGGSGQ